MRSERRGMVYTGWAMTLIGSGTVLFWLIYESITTFRSAPVDTIIGVVVVLLVLALLVPVPLILATRRAKARRAS
ncbi:MAG TPA: hypothetical protein VNL71_12935 [Chloroflexota bacterium]|nr:hypothetical protein [Chloroflexota bacterium]